MTHACQRMKWIWKGLYTFTYSVNSDCKFGIFKKILKRYIFIVLHPPNLFLRKRVDPELTTRPDAIIAILSPSTSASSMWWVVTNTVLRLRSRWTVFHTQRRDSGSNPELGSSRITTFKRHNNHCEYKCVTIKHVVKRFWTRENI